jgi:hypothetical protein
MGRLSRKRCAGAVGRCRKTPNSPQRDVGNFPENGRSRECPGLPTTSGISLQDSSPPRVTNRWHPVAASLPRGLLNDTRLTGEYHSILFGDTWPSGRRFPRSSREGIGRPETGVPRHAVTGPSVDAPVLFPNPRIIGPKILAQRTRRAPGRRGPPSHLPGFTPARHRGLCATVPFQPHTVER